VDAPGERAGHHAQQDVDRREHDQDGGDIGQPGRGGLG
jgi:hypothetical protein